MATDVRAELAAERQHLEASRTALVAMRARAAEIGDVAVDPFASEALGKARARRLAQLVDDPTTPLFFGRLDNGSTPEQAAETFHIGRRHVVDGRGEPMVVDWRAPISLPFYRASAVEPMGVELRRRFGFSAGEITSFEDEPLTAGVALGLDSRLLAAEIERPRVGPMRDIVATIQPDQDELVRADLSETLCIQGAPGTGKTAVGLHRAAYLLYTFRDRLRRGGVLVVGPNRAFLSYIGDVLPALGEVDVTQTTVDELPAGVVVRAEEPAAVAVLKGDARLAKVVRKALYAGVRRPTTPLVLTVGGRRRRVDPEPIRALVRDLLHTDVRYATARDRLRAHIAELVRRDIEAEGAAPSDEAARRIATCPEMREYVDTHWPPVDAAGLVLRLWTDPELLRHAAEGLLDDAEQTLLQWPATPRSARSAPWSSADAFVIDEAADLLERERPYGHLILDEAQDLSPMQCRAVGRRCQTGSATVLGDVAQGTTPWATTSWSQTLAHLGKPAGRITPLTRGYRVPQEVLDLANRLLPHIASDVSAATSVRRGAGSLRLRSAKDAVVEAAAAVRRLLEDDEGSIGVIAVEPSLAPLRAALDSAGISIATLGDDDEAIESRVELVATRLAKGLEFDHVVVVEPADIVAAEERGLRRLYVVLTRAVSTLTVVHATPLPAELRG
ncbi:MAG TPA: AAA family ATPase [Mycobacteriales bacterium]|nr:AAA family ATPase [Mycobacteriales bacterium]